MHGDTLNIDSLRELRSAQNISDVCIMSPAYKLMVSRFVSSIAPSLAMTSLGSCCTKASRLVGRWSSASEELWTLLWAFFLVAMMLVEREDYSDLYCTL